MTPITFHFTPMTQEFANSIVGTWKYEREYSIYDYCNEADHMLDPEAWEKGIHAVLDQAGDLVGELSIEFIDSQGDFVQYHDFGDETRINQAEMWIGFGLRPDLVGKGHGTGFVQACTEYALQVTHYQGQYVRLGVALFNARAIKTYEKAGFTVFEETEGDIAGKTFACVHMRKKVGER